MVSKNKYDAEIATYINNLDNEARKILLQKTLEIVFHPNTKIEVEENGLDNDLIFIEMNIDEFNEKYKARLE